MKTAERFPEPEIVPLLTAAEVAGLLGIKRSAVYNLCCKPDSLRAYKVGGCVRFKREEVEEYRQKAPRQVVTTPDEASEPIAINPKAAGL